MVVVLAILSPVAAQTGGQYDLSHNVIASGGGSNSAGGTLSIDGTVGQPIAGVQSSSTTFSLRGGFWTFQSFGPTAAGVSVGGRIRTSDGHGLRGVVLTLTNLSTGSTVIAVSSSFGYYRFEDVPVGNHYLLSVSAKGQTFDPTERMFTLLDELSEENFTALPREPLAF